MVAMEDNEDDKAMFNLYKNYYGLVHRQFRITNDFTNSEDLINDCFVKLIESFIIVPSTPQTNTYVVIRQKRCTNFIKRRKVRISIHTLVLKKILGMHSALEDN